MKVESNKMSITSLSSSERNADMDQHHPKENFGLKLKLTHMPNTSGVVEVDTKGVIVKKVQTCLNEGYSADKFTSHIKNLQVVVTKLPTRANDPNTNNTSSISGIQVTDIVNIKEQPDMAGNCENTDSCLKLLQSLMSEQSPSYKIEDTKNWKGKSSVKGVMKTSLTGMYPEELSEREAEHSSFPLELSDINKFNELMQSSLTCVNSGDYDAHQSKSGATDHNRGTNSNYDPSARSVEQEKSQSGGSSGGEQEEKEASSEEEYVSEKKVKRKYTKRTKPKHSNTEPELLKAEPKQLNVKRKYIKRAEPEPLQLKRKYTKNTEKESQRVKRTYVRRSEEESKRGNRRYTRKTQYPVKYIQDPYKRIFIDAESVKYDITKESESGKQRLLCKLCKKVVHENEKMSHSKHHSLYGVLECVECSAKHVTVPGIKKHLLTQHGIKEMEYTIMPKHNRTSPVTMQLKTGELIVTNNIEDLYTKTATDPENVMTNHVIEALDDGTYTCSQCKNHFSNERSANRHVKQSKDIKAYITECKLCDYVSDRAGVIVAHLKRMHIEKQYKCELCELSCITLHHLRDHMKTHSLLKPHKCPYCGKGQNSDKALVTHIRNAHDNMSGITISLVCHLCGKTFKKPRHAKNHAIVAHGDKHYVCTICGMGYSFKTALKSHMNNIHKKIANCTCDICGKSFFDVVNLRAHKKSVHTQATNECPNCGKMFKRKDNLVVHMRIHTGEKPLSCQFCEFRCIQKNSMTVHMKSHHPYTMTT